MTTTSASRGTLAPFPRPTPSADMEVHVAGAGQHLEPAGRQEIGPALDHPDPLVEQLDAGVEDEDHPRLEAALDPPADLQRLQPDRRVGHADPVAEPPHPGPPD